MKPAPIHGYNFAMNGCDRMDQLVSYYGCHGRKTIKWWRKLFSWILEIVQCNAHILNNLLMTSRGERPQSLKNFKRNIISSIQKIISQDGVPAMVSPRPGRRPILAPFVSDRLDTTKMHLPRRCAEGKKLSCVLCMKRGTRCRSVYFCTGCSDKPHLSIAQNRDCFF